MALQPIVLRKEVNAPVYRLWQAWVNPNELTSWLSEQANVSPVVGGPYELFWEPAHPERNSTIGCTLTAVEPLRRLEFSWRGPVPYADLMNQEPLPTSVRVTFRSTGLNRSVFQLEHAGWGDGPRWAEARIWQQQAWEVAFARLLERLGG